MLEFIENSVLLSNSIRLCSIEQGSTYISEIGNIDCIKYIPSPNFLTIYSHPQKINEIELRDNEATLVYRLDELPRNDVYKKLLRTFHLKGINLEFLPQSPPDIEYVLISIIYLFGPTRELKSVKALVDSLSLPHLFPLYLASTYNKRIFVSEDLGLIIND